VNIVRIGNFGGTDLTLRLADFITLIRATVTWVSLRDSWPASHAFNEDFPTAYDNSISGNSLVTDVP
jgi:hypothetical protein